MKHAHTISTALRRFGICFAFHVVFHLCLGLCRVKAVQERSILSTQNSLEDIAQILGENIWF